MRQLNQRLRPLPLRPAPPGDPRPRPRLSWCSQSAVVSSGYGGGARRSPPRLRPPARQPALLLQRRQMTGPCRLLHLLNQAFRLRQVTRLRLTPLHRQPLRLRQHRHPLHVPRPPMRWPRRWRVSRNSIGRATSRRRLASWTESSHQLTAASLRLQGVCGRQRRVRWMRRTQRRTIRRHASSRRLSTRMASGRSALLMPH